MDIEGALVKLTHAFVVASIAMTLVGCGGGGGGGGDGGGSPAPSPGSPAPGPAVTLTPRGPIEVGAATGDAFTATLDVTVTASGLSGSDRIFLRIRDTASTFETPTPQPAQPDQTFRYALLPRNGLLPGNYLGQLEITPCRDGSCSATYGAAVRVSYRVDISSLGEWTTIQRDATHAGYVPTEFDPTRLQLAWEWRPPRDPASVSGFVTRPVTGGGNVYITGGSILSNGTQRGLALYALNDTSGRQIWSYTVPDSPRTLAPASAAGLVLLPTLSDNTLLTALAADTGAVRYKYAQTTTLGAQILPPSSFQGRTYFFAGVTGDEIHAMDNATGQRLWARPRKDGAYATPTVNASNVFYQAANSLEILDLESGATVASIADPSTTGDMTPLSSVVVLGSRGNAMMNSSGSPTRAPITSFDIAGRRWQWTTAQSYLPLFAAGDGGVYGIRRATAPTLDAIDESNGQLLWSWSPPASDAQDEMVGNILVTRNMVFVSTTGTINSWVWAIDRTTGRFAWRYPNGGYLAMSGSRTLLVLSGLPGDNYDAVRAFRVQ